MSTVLFDNWSLEHATTLLTFSYEKYKAFSYRYSSPERNLNDIYTGQRNNKVNGIKDELLMTFSLNRFIESLILYDDISYIKPYSNTWKKRNYEELGLLKPLLSEIEITDGFYEECNNRAKIILKNNKLSHYNKYSSIVTEGAISYLIIGQKLGVTYNAAPFRSDFIINSGLADLTSSRNILINMIDKKTNEIIEELNDKLGTATFEIDVPPITNYVLNQADNLYSIPKIIAEIRESKESIGLRNWLAQMESFISDGKVIDFQKGIDGVNDIILDFKRVFQEEKSDGGQVQIGLSPSISLPLDSWKKIKGIKTPLHLVLLKDIVKNLFQARNYQKNLGRLFQLRYSNIESIEGLIQELTKPNK